MDFAARYLRFAAFSVVAIAIAVCGRLGVADAEQFRTQPRVSEPPTRESPVVAEAPETVESLQARLDELDARIVHLRKMVEIMNPPVRAEEYLVAAASRSDLYAPPPDLPLARSVFAWAESCTTFASPPSACRPVEARTASR